MRFGGAVPFARPPLSVSDLQLGEEVLPFVLDLTRGHDQRAVPALAVPDLGLVELVAALAGLVEDSREVAVDRGHGVAALSKAVELRVLSVAGRRPDKYGASEQAFTPESHQPTGVEVTRME